MNKALIAIGAFALSACDVAKENANDADIGVGDLAKSVISDSIKERLASGDLTVCADEQIADFIVAKAREDVGMPPLTMRMEQQPDWFMGFADLEGLRFQQSHWDAAVQEVEVKVGAITAEGYDGAIDELGCAATLHIGDETQPFNFVVRPGLRDGTQFIVGGSVPQQPRRIDNAVRRQALRILQSTLPTVPTSESVSESSEPSVTPDEPSNENGLVPN